MACLEALAIERVQSTDRKALLERSRAELDKLHVVTDAKSSQQTKRGKAERSRELELADFLTQAAQLADKLSGVEDRPRSEDRAAVGSAQA